MKGTLKDNIHLEKAMITGILRVAKESVFSGLNNLMVYSMLSESFSDKFGFTEEDEILLVKQKVSKDRNWSLPGGRLERGESLETAIVRELKEETGYDGEVVKFLYLCEKVEEENTL